MAVEELRNEPGRRAEGRSPKLAKGLREVRQAARVGEIENAQGPDHLQSLPPRLFPSRDLVDHDQRSPELYAELDGGQFADMESRSDAKVRLDER